MKKIVWILFTIFCFMKAPVIDVEAQSFDSSVPILVSSSTIEVEQKQEERNFLEEFYYRMFEKDTKDFFDYVLLGIFIVGLLIVMVLQNTHYYTVRKETPKEDWLEEETSHQELTFEPIDTPIEVKKREDSLLEDDLDEIDDLEGKVSVRIVEEPPKEHRRRKSE